MRGWLGLRFVLVAMTVLTISSNLRSTARQAAPSTPAQTTEVTPRPRGLTGALDWYLQGRFDEAVNAVVRFGGLKPVDAERWITAGGRAKADPRRLTVAVFALEYGAVRPHLIPALVTWARQLMADPQAPHPAEGLWLRASVALAEGAGKWSFLKTAPLPPTDKRAQANRGPEVSHLEYARRRFPNNPYFKIAEAVGLEYLTSPAEVNGMVLVPRGDAAFDRLAADMADATPDPARRAELLSEAVPVLE